MGSEFTDESLMPFGKYKGKKMQDVPANYLDWLHGQEWLKSWPSVYGYIEDNRKWIDKELEREEK